MSAPITKLTPTSLSALLCARICHDLISPVGALGTAIEILDDPSNVDMHDDAMVLVRTASRQASAKLKFLRIAFGAAGSAPGVISTAEIMTLTNDMFKDAKADLIWHMDTDGIDKDRARILMNLVMLAVQAAPRGGTVTITRVGRGPTTEAGADFFLMPSRFEPCGLNQMYSMIYGTPPIVRATGGLIDSVEQYIEGQGAGTGFVFQDATPDALYYTIGWACSTYYDRPEEYAKLQQNGMQRDFSWDASASTYEDLYSWAVDARNAAFASKIS